MTLTSPSTFAMLRGILKGSAEGSGTGLAASQGHKPPSQVLGRPIWGPKPHRGA